MGVHIKSIAAVAAAGVALAPVAASAAAVQLCENHFVQPDATGRILGHLLYGEALPSDLVLAPPGFELGQPCRIQRAAAVDLTRMLRDLAAVPGVADTLRAISCYRAIERQRQVFCAKLGPDRAFSTPVERARYVGPPGYSEHATGYAIDFGVRPSPGCPDLNSCIAGSPAGRWLLSHARDYGFELSFPAGNLQGVTWEPWHWRWVGTTLSAPGAITARAIFARARASYRANPAITDASDKWLQVVRPPAPVNIPTLYSKPALVGPQSGGKPLPSRPTPLLPKR